MTQKPPTLRPVPIHIVDKIMSLYEDPMDTGFVFITQTLSPKIYNWTTRHQFKMTTEVICSLLREICEDFTVVAELTKQGNIHYHIHCYLQSGYSFIHYKDSMKHHPLFGHCHLTEMKTEKTHAEQVNQVRNYMLKDVRETYRMIRDSRLVMTAGRYNQIYPLDDPDCMDDYVLQSLNLDEK